jgi:ribose transport system ATP-binding protein
MTDPPRLAVNGLSKTFGRNRALRDLSLSIAAGEIHGLVGQNGSGKSTFAKLLSGFHTPDPGGAMLVDGVPLRLPTRAAELRDRGVAVVHQDLGLVDRCTVVENLRIGAFSANRLSRAIRWPHERELARATLAELGHDIDPRARVGDLSAADRATVAIARALQHQAPGHGLVMFDESTRALPRASLDHFYALVRRIAVRGGSVLLVSHHLDEVLALADRVTVLRDGAVTGSSIATDELTEGKLIGLMLGHSLRQQPRTERARVTASAPGIRAQGVSGRLVRDLDLNIGAGEVVGVTGLVGSGYEELPYLLAGAARASAGTLTIGDNRIELVGASPRDLLAAGLALVPERRDEHGLALSLSVLKNVTLPQIGTGRSKAWIGSAWELQEARWVVDQLGVRPADPQHRVGDLSGGNQQKVLLGKWLRTAPTFLLLHEPTQGVDVGAHDDLITAVRQAANEGSAVLVAGLDPAELVALCDRVVVLREGRAAAELTPPITADEIVVAVYGATAGTMVHRGGGGHDGP